MRLVLAALVVLVMGCAVAGVGMGEATAERAAAPAAAAVAAAERRIAALPPQGRRLFADEGCGRCHSIAAIGAGGKLGPRLDRLDDDEDDVAESVTDPRDEVEDGYPEKLMPGDFAQRLSEREIGALARLVAAASGTEAEDERRDGDDSRRGRGRGRSGGDD